MYFETGQGSRAHLRQARGHRHGHLRGPVLRPRAALRPVHGQQRHRLHRARDAPRRLRDDPRQPAGPLHGQAARAADGHGAVLHAALGDRHRGPPDGHADAHRGRARTTSWTSTCRHRPHARLLRHERPRRPDAARDPRPRAGRRVPGVGARPGHLRPRRTAGGSSAGRAGATRGRSAPPRASCGGCATAMPAAYGFASAGPRPANAVSRAMRADQALAREAIRAELDEDQLGDEVDVPAGRDGRGAARTSTSPTPGSAPAWRRTRSPGSAPRTPTCRSSSPTA